MPPAFMAAKKPSAVAEISFLARILYTVFYIQTHDALPAWHAWISSQKEMDYLWTTVLKRPSLTMKNPQ
jgi:hypothetical protein